MPNNEAAVPKLKLSEAIRLGAMLAPQGWRALVDSEGRTCALGAALAASGAITIDALRELFPILEALYVGCPVDGYSKLRQPLSIVIVRLNDIFGWTRETIADWVATVEPPEPEIEEVKVDVAEGEMVCVQG